MTDYFESEEYKEYSKWSKVIIAELDKWFESHPLSEVKTLQDNRIYWHNKIKWWSLFDDSRSLSKNYLGFMKICIQCLEHSKTISKESVDHWKEYWASFVLDTSGEARCILGYPYHPKMKMYKEDKKEEWIKYHDITY